MAYKIKNGIRLLFVGLFVVFLSFLTLMVFYPLSVKENEFIRVIEGITFLLVFLGILGVITGAIIILIAEAKIYEF